MPSTSRYSPALRRGVRERLYEPLAGVLDRLHRVGDHERAQRRAADDDVLPGLPDDVDMAAHGHEAAEHAAERDHETEMMVTCCPHRCVRPKSKFSANNLART